jgi:hypothetical protein
LKIPEIKKSQMKILVCPHFTVSIVVDSRILWHDIMMSWNVNVNVISLPDSLDCRPLAAHEKALEVDERNLVVEM